MTCKQADRVAERFLRALKLSGGMRKPPAPSMPTATARPDKISTDFTYYGAGYLIPGTGLKPNIPGNADYTVYVSLRFPLKEAPAFANSQSFNNWGDCDFTGRSVAQPAQERPALFVQGQRTGRWSSTRRAGATTLTHGAIISASIAAISSASAPAAKAIRARTSGQAIAR